jgi:hypothetical protein
MEIALAVIGDMDISRWRAIVLGCLFAVVAITLLIASWTKWGQHKSLTKCIALAFLAHVWLLMYAYGTRVMSPGSGGGDNGGRFDPNVAISMMIPETGDEEFPRESEGDDENRANEVLEATSSEQTDAPKLAPWEIPLAKQPDDSNNDQIPAPKLDATRLRSGQESPRDVQPSPTILSLVNQLSPSSVLSEVDLPTMPTEQQFAHMATAVGSEQNASITPAPIAPLQPVTRTDWIQSIRQDSARSHPAQAAVSARTAVPMSYQMRLSPNKVQFAMLSGGDANTEAAVERALAWLARNQGPDGGWNAAEHGAGRESSYANGRPDGEYRHQAGLKANTAMTGLALLAFLGAGHTHVGGKYASVVSRGLSYLIHQQLPSGDLSGREQIGREPTVRYARMYSHGMASLALVEAYAMTGDQALLLSVQSACRYTLGAMNPKSGGWRYEFPTEDPGDTSQFGWQAMLLNAADGAKAITLVPETRNLMHRFLDSVSTGRAGGLAVYRARPGMPATADASTPSMTAEAMSSRLLLGVPTSAQATEECQRMLLANLPGKSEENFYYWYYATLAMYQLRGDGELSNIAGDPWLRWNDALKNQLCATQVARGVQEGSWNPSCIWGGYGGRVYATATACMCLEVYYRYLPMYKADHFASQWQPSRR